MINFFSLRNIRSKFQKIIFQERILFKAFIKSGEPKSTMKRIKEANLNTNSNLRKIRANFLSEIFAPEPASSPTRKNNTKK